MTPTDWLAAAQQLQQTHQAFALVTVLRVTPPTSARPGDKAVVTADGRIQGWIGGGCAQPAVIKTVRQALADGQPRTIRITPASESEEKQLGDVLEFGMACHSGGVLELFIDPVLPVEPLTLFGDSPVARALCDLAPRVGFSVRVVAQGGTPDAFPAAQQVLDSDEPALLTEHLAPGGWAVVATQGKRDLPALKAALRLDARRIWFVASERKAGVLKDSLRTAGEDERRVGAIVAPAGTPIGAETPEEIALSVLAAVVAARRQKVNDTVAKPSCCGGRKAAQALEAGPSAPAVVSAALPSSASVQNTVAITDMMATSALAEPVTLEPVTAQGAAQVAATAPKKSCCGG
jgi:xanthine dehydrogenase accessory factor